MKLLIPLEVVYTLSIVAGLSCITGMVHAERLTRSSMLTMFRMGLSILTSCFIPLGTIQIIFSADDQLMERLSWGRIVLSYQFILVIFWMIFLHLKGKKL